MSRLIILMFYFSLLFNAACQKQDEYQSRAEEVFPPITIKYAALNQIGGLPVTPAFFQGQWSIVIFGEPNCSDECLKRLALINPVKQAKKLFVIDGLASHAELNELGAKFTNVAITMGVTASSYDSFDTQFVIEGIEPAKKKLMIYLINPAAELVYSLSSDNLTVVDLEKEIAVIKN
ncbi:MAG: hypothetical protein GY744_03940 [Gammaproteobacteria bacterium]|nr:hypothetical protein [Gammaproteobacteria bacterium]